MHTSCRRGSWGYRRLVSGIVSAGHLSLTRIGPINRPRSSYKARGQWIPYFWNSTYHQIVSQHVESRFLPCVLVKHPTHCYQPRGETKGKCLTWKRTHVVIKYKWPKTWWSAFPHFQVSQHWFIACSIVCATYAAHELYSLGELNHWIVMPKVCRFRAESASLLICACERTQCQRPGTGQGYILLLL